MDFDAGDGNPDFHFDATKMVVPQKPNVVPQKPNTAVDPAKLTGPPSADYNLVRLNSLLAQFPLALTGFLQQSKDIQPEDMGFRVLETTIPSGITPASLQGQAWSALEFTLNLGGHGTVGAGSALTAQMQLAWTAGGAGTASVAPTLKIAGPGGVSLNFDFEGVLKFGAQDIVLNRLPAPDTQNSQQATTPTPPQFILLFESIGVSLLSLSIPPRGSTNVVILGDMSATQNSVLDPTLGWYGGYLQKKAAKPATSSSTGD
jgi:hypothetical protein